MGRVISLNKATVLSEKIEAPKETQELMDAIENEFKKKLPNGFVKLRVTKIIGDPFISVSFGMIGDEKDLTSNIRGNDPALNTYMIKGLDKEGNLTTAMEVNKQHSGININPPADSHLAMGSAKVPFRKFKGDSEKIKKGMFKEIKKIVDTLKANKDNIYRGDKYDKKYFKGL